MRTFFLSISFFLILSGCVTEVGAGRRPTGAPLRIATRVHAETGTVREQVGTVQYTTSAGRAAGAAAVYANRSYTQTHVLWRAYQGSEPLADEDLFRFAGDRAAADKSRAYRTRGRWMMRLGIAAGLVGAGLLIAGGATENIDLTIAGGIGFGLGPSVAYFGSRYLHPDAHAMPLSRAEAAVDAYNRGLGAP